MYDASRECDGVRQTHDGIVGSVSGECHGVRQTYSKVKSASGDYVTV